MELDTIGYNFDDKPDQNPDTSFLDLDYDIAGENFNWLLFSTMIVLLCAEQHGRSCRIKHHLRDLISPS